MGGKKCVDSWLWHRKLKMPINKRFASKVIMFKEHFKLKKSIIMCYCRHKTMMLQQVPNLGYKGITSCLNPIVNMCVTN